MTVRTMGVCNDHINVTVCLSNLRCRRARVIGRIGAGDDRMPWSVGKDEGRIWLELTPEQYATLLDGKEWRAT